MSSFAKPLTDVRSLTGLRGVAALLVIGFHCHSILPSHPLPSFPFSYGYMGVDVFFVLSGFILSSLNHSLTFASSADFYLRRIFRIYPLHVSIMVALAALVTFARIKGFSIGDHYEPSTFLPVVLLAHVPLNIYGWNDPTWSLSVEIACYLTLPFAMPSIRKFERPACILLIALLLSMDMLVHARMLLINDDRIMPFITGWPPLARGFLGFYAGCLLSRLYDMSTFDRCIFWRPLRWKPIYWIGEISFSLYLVHQPLLSLGKRVDPVLAAHHLSPLLVPSFLCLVVAISALTYRLIEQPGRRVSKRVAAWGGASARRPGVVEHAVARLTPDLQASRSAS